MLRNFISFAENFTRNLIYYGSSLYYDLTKPITELLDSSLGITLPDAFGQILGDVSLLSFMFGSGLIIFIIYTVTKYIISIF